MSSRTCMKGILALALILGLVFVFMHFYKPSASTSRELPSVGVSPPTFTTGLLPKSEATTKAIVQGLVWPIDQPKERVAKKPFCLQVSPTDSPVQPERFTGYHTGVDFEATADEADKDVAVRAVCNGRLLVKRSATGYGGVAVQSCVVGQVSVTIIYGHLKLSSMSVKAGDELVAGQTFALLGRGNSAETGGERKHLHLGIHRGDAVNIRGYVPFEAELKDWMDIRDLVL